MPRLLHGLRKLSGILLIGVGLIVGVLGFCWTLLFAWVRFKGEPLAASDQAMWLVCLGMAIMGGGLFWTGAAVYRTRPGPGEPARPFRLVQPPRQRRWSPARGYWSTFIWLLLGAEFLWIPRIGDAPLPFYALPLELAAIFLGVHVVFLCHEFGHLAVAAGLGLDLQKVQIGTGPLVCGLTVRGLRLEWRALLGGGLIHSADDRERGWRWRHCLYVAGGPLGHAAFCLALAGWVWRRHGGAWLPPGPADPVGATALYVAGLGGFFWIFSVLPGRSRVGTVRVHSDGWQLLHVPRFSAEQVQLAIAVTVLRRVDSLWEEGRRDAAWTRLRQLLATLPDLLAICPAEGHYLAEGGDYAAAAISYEHALTREGLPDTARRMVVAQRFGALARADDPGAARRCAGDALRDPSLPDRPAWLDALATEVLKVDQPAFLPDADGWTQEALALAPDQITLRGTRGAVLIGLGRLEEGEGLLREVWQRSVSETDAAISAYYLAVTAARRGERREFARWKRRARSLAAFMDKWFTRRLDHLGYPGEATPGGAARSASSSAAASN